MFKIVGYRFGEPFMKSNISKEDFNRTGVGDTSFSLAGFLGVHHLYMYSCVFLRFSVCHKIEFPWRNGRRGLKFCEHTQIGLTRWKMTKINLGVPPPLKKIRVPKKKIKLKKSKLFKIAWNGEIIGRKQFLDFLAPPPKKRIT